MKEKIYHNKKIMVLLFLQLLIGITYNIAHPATPKLIKSIGAESNVFGYFMASMSLAQFIAAPFWGQLSDKYGRWLLALGPLGYGVGQMMFGYGTNIYFIIFARFIAGFFVVITFSVHLAYLGDISSKEIRKTVISYATMIFSLGSGIAYFIGGYLGEIDYHIPFTVQFVTGILFFIIFIFMVKDFKKPANAGEKLNLFKMLFSTDMVKNLKKYKGTIIPVSMLLCFFYVIAFSLHTGAVPYFLSFEMNFSTTQLGNAIGFIYLFGAIINFLIIPVLSNKMHMNKAYFYYSIVGFFGLLLITINFLTINIVVIFIIFHTVMCMLDTGIQVVTQDILQTVGDREDAGSLLGLKQAIQSFGYVLGFLSLSLLYGINAYFPFITAIIIFAICIAVSYKKAYTKKIFS